MSFRTDLVGEQWLVSQGVRIDHGLEAQQPVLGTPSVSTQPICSAQVLDSPERPVVALALTDNHADIDELSAQGIWNVAKQPIDVIHFALLSDLRRHGS